MGKLRVQALALKALRVLWEPLFSPPSLAEIPPTFWVPLGSRLTWVGY